MINIKAFYISLILFKKTDFEEIFPKPLFNNVTFKEKLKYNYLKYKTKKKIIHNNKKKYNIKIEYKNEILDELTIKNINSQIFFKKNININYLTCIELDDNLSHIIVKKIFNTIIQSLKNIINTYNQIKKNLHNTTYNIPLVICDIINEYCKYNNIIIDLYFNENYMYYYYDYLKQYFKQKYIQNDINYLKKNIHKILIIKKKSLVEINISSVDGFDWFHFLIFKTYAFKE